MHPCRKKLFYNVLMFYVNSPSLFIINHRQNKEVKIHDYMKVPPETSRSSGKAASSTNGDIKRKITFGQM